MKPDATWFQSRIPSSIGPVEGLQLEDADTALATGPEDGAPRVFPITVGLLRGDAESFVERVNAFDRALRPPLQGAPYRSPVRSVPPQHRRRPGGKAAAAAGQGDARVIWISLLVTARFLRLMAEPDAGTGTDNPVRDVWQFILGTAVPPDALPDDALGDIAPRPAPALPDAPPAPGTVITAVIDDGLPIGHVRFRSAETQTRIEYAWVQDGRFRPSGSHVHYGREYTRADIDGYLDAARVGDRVDEGAFYRLSGLVNYGDRKGRTRLGRRVTHGAGVLDQAAGYGPLDADKPARNPIITVQLPQSVTADSSGQSADTYVQDALDYILDRADRIAADLGEGSGRLPLVINFSYGFIAGPHDGTHPLEVLMEQILATRNAARPITAIVLPAGNSRQAQCHGRITGAAGGAPTVPDLLTWRVLPDDRTPSHAVFYMPATDAPPDPGRVTVRLRTPTGEVSPALPEVNGLSWAWRPDGDKVVARISYQFIGAPTRRGRYVIAVRPTRALDRRVPVAPCGDWIIEIANLSLGPHETIEAYVQRDDTPFGYTERGRQSYFVDPGYHRFDVQGKPVDTDSPGAYVKRDGTLNALATGQGPVVIGGFDRIYGQPALYSAAGPGLAPQGGGPARSSPDALAPSDTTRVHTGILGAATRSGSVFALGGTSIAAPRIARRIAQAMAAGTWTGAGDVATWVAAPVPPFWPPVTVTRAGAGRIPTLPIVPVPRVDPP